MNEIIEFLKGKKTYIFAAVTVILGVLQGLGFFVLPEYAWPILIVLLGASLRAGVNKVADAVKPPS